MSMFAASICILLFVDSVSGICSSPGPHRDLPNPGYLQLKSFPIGTWLIPMDEKQLDSSGKFNLAVYGFIVAALWENLDVYWIISGCKPTNGVDFTVSARRLYPIWNEAPNYHEDFRYGAFAIIQPHYAYRVYAKYALEVVARGLEPPSIYDMEEQMILEVRHKLKQKPRIAVLAIEDEPNLHTDILQAAGLKEGKHFFNDINVNEHSCYSLVTHPGVDLLDDPSLVLNVLDFVKSGGNFFAQDRAALVYEQMHFLLNLKTTRLTSGSKTWNKNGKVPFGSVHYPDLAYLQFKHSDGFNYSSNDGSWDSGNVAALANYPGNVYVDLKTDLIFKTMAGQVIGYPEGKLGGMVFYMAGQQYRSDCKKPLCSQNAMRMFMNVVLIPAKVNKTCRGIHVKKNKRCQTSGPPSHWCPDNVGPQYCDWNVACETMPHCMTLKMLLERACLVIPIIAIHV